MEYMWWPKGSSTFTWHAAWLHQILLLWDSRDKISHYEKKQWPKCSLTPGQKNVINPPLVDPGKNYQPPLHIKLGLMRNFVKGMDELAGDSLIWRISLQGFVMQILKKAFSLDHRLETWWEIKSLMKSSVVLKNCMAFIQENMQRFFGKLQSR